VPTKYVIAGGFVIMGLAMFYSHRIAPDVSFGELVIIRCAQSAALAFLFAPLTTIAFVNISREDTGDASALFTMFRNVSGSIGISLTTATVAERTQTHMAYLDQHMTPLDRGYMVTLQQYQHALVAHGGHAAAAIGRTALGQLYRAFQTQAQILAYTDIFVLAGILAFCAVPIAFFLTSRTAAEAPAIG
jgi:DHA2 family multidrug resistance protein